MSIPPQTGAGGSVNTQSLLQQVLNVSGTGGGGMNPPGSTGIVSLGTSGTNGLATYNPTTGNLNIPNYKQFPAGSTGITALTTSGASGPSTYDPVGGGLNIPVYASGVLSAQDVYPLSTITFNSTTAVSTGLGFPFTANVNNRALVGFSMMVSGVANLIPGLAVYRTTGAIPAMGATPGGSDFLVFSMRMVVGTMRLTLSASWIDYQLTVGTPYNYYLAGWLTTSTAGTATILADVNTFFAAFELK